MRMEEARYIIAEQSRQNAKYINDQAANTM